MSDMIQAYCVKCKTKREIGSPQAVYTDKGTPATRGQCPVCGTTLFRMGATDAHANLPKPEKVVTPKTAKTTKKTKPKTKGSKAATQSEPKKSARSGGPVGKLVIVESPAKARSVSNFLGKGYTVKASKGHVRDLLVTQLSVDVEKNFEPKYRVPNDKREIVSELRSAVEKATEIYLATDPDREGEAIAWHLIAAADIDASKTKRVVFHEITQPAIQEAFGHPRILDMNLVNAQQARRILDRLVGYNITELLWEKVRNQLSAGRVQSIAVRLVVDREREIEAFAPEEYWTLDAQLQKQAANGKHDNKAFVARLVKIQGNDVNFHREADVLPHLDILERSQYNISDVKHGTRQRKPSAPFTTSTLQQEASRRLGFTARRTMTIAQQLYEGMDIGATGSIGLITYMRTDSTQVSTQAQAEARSFIHNRFGEKYHPERPPIYQTKAKGAQEAHEAIRPTSVMREPDQMKNYLNRDQFRLYQLVWQRFVASQMANAIYNTLRVEINAGLNTQERPYLFRVSGSTIKFPGFLALYEDARDEDVAPDEDEGRILPELAVGDLLDLLRLLPEQHFTQPPPRYTEATLVRTLEEYGIGRPSTYAPTVATIQDREYIEKQDKRLAPTETGKTVNDLLVEFFPDVMDYQFTARMEDQLDDVAEGHREWHGMMGTFYSPFSQQLEAARVKMPQIRQEELVGRDCPESGHPLVIRYGRFGKFIGCSNYPECRYTEPWLERTGILCPVCGKTHAGEIIVRKSRKGRIFYGCTRYPDCDYTSWKRPLVRPCPNCGGLLIEQNRTTAQCANCEHTYQMDELGESTVELA
ncbi:MAG TPA: type I DNA topoisomerase [Phototrophicaceae bacterium]|nr:type I DNA topoisomerase [Phototrophicaceae bacterium]